MNRQQLERAIWHSLRDLGADRHPHARNILDNILDNADRYATTRAVDFHAALAATDTPGNTRLRREAAAAELSRPRGAA
jgi:hypothetical protein